MILIIDMNFDSRNAFITVYHFYKAQNTPCICGNINDTPRISHNIICQTIETVRDIFLGCRP